jgi:hypothetical protein
MTDIDPITLCDEELLAIRSTWEAERAPLWQHVVQHKGFDYQREYDDFMARRGRLKPRLASCVGEGFFAAVGRRAVPLTCMAFFARDVASGRRPGSYSARRAEHFARCALLPDEEFAALERFPEPVIAEYFNVPLDQVTEKRVDLEAAVQLAELESGQLLR